MDLSQIYQLLKKHLDGNISPEESLLLEEIIDQTDSKVTESVLIQILADSESDLNNVDTHFNRIRFEDVWNQIQSADPKPQKKPFGAHTLKYLHYVTAVAAVSIGAFFLVKNSISTSDSPKIDHVQDINPARSLAKIVLANGEELTIDSATTGLVYQRNGISMFRSAEGIIEYKLDSLAHTQDQVQYITVSTPKGGFTKLTFADGSTASLNSASTITYPIKFTMDQRAVNAEGEIYFDIAKDKDRPFRIISEKQKIEVLGTSFNLLSNSSEAKTTLIEGSVKVIANNKSYLLKPGQQSIVNNTVLIIDTDSKDAIAWTNDQFVFDNGSYFDLLKEIENWYDVRFVFERTDIQNMELSGSLSRKVKLSELLKVLSINTGYKYEMQERRILVK